MISPSKHQNLSQGFSSYLDLLRVIAALLVMASHFPLTQWIDESLSKTNFAYDAVIVFFVLSGYVISYAADTREHNPKTFTANRMARILPVAVTSIVVAAVCSSIAGPIRPDLYHDLIPWTQWPGVALRSITFTNEIWTSHITPFGNGPYWSLSFEVWCYVFYGVAIYSRGWRRAILLITLAAFLGPKQIIMLPMWLAGSAAYHLKDKFIPNKLLTVALLVLPAIAYLVIQIPLPRDWSYAYVGSKAEALLGFGLDGAANSGWGYLLALLVATHLYAACQLGRYVPLNSSGRIATTIRLLSSYTFTLYLFHAILIKFMETMFGIANKDTNPLHTTPVYLLTFLFTYIIGNFVEHKKLLYRQWANLAITSFTKRLTPKFKF